MARVSGHMAPAKKGKRKVTEIRIRHAGNGHIVSHDKEPEKKMKHGMMMPSYEPPQENVFTDPDAAKEHVGDLMGQMGGAEAGAPAPTA